MKHVCKSCGAKVLFLLDGGVCKACYAAGLGKKCRSDKGKYRDAKVKLMRKQERIRKKLIEGTAKLMFCKCCDQEFYQGHPNQIYCSDACNRKVNNHKRWLRIKGEVK